MRLIYKNQRHKICNYFDYFHNNFHNIYYIFNMKFLINNGMININKFHFIIQIDLIINMMYIHPN